MKSTPLSQVKERFGDKAKLVAAVTQLATEELWLGRLNEQKGLESVSNTKLLKLHGSLTALKKDFGSRDKLVSEILKLEKRTGDAGYKARLAGYPTPRLLDLHHAAARRARHAEAKTSRDAATPARQKPARTRKAQAKRAALGKGPKKK